jgi:hypothetical protein
VYVKVAVTFFIASMVTTHDPAPAHAPDQPVKVLFTSVVAVMVTIAPSV